MDARSPTSTVHRHTAYQKREILFTLECGCKCKHCPWWQLSAMRETIPRADLMGRTKNGSNGADVGAMRVSRCAVFSAGTVKTEIWQHPERVDSKLPNWRARWNGSQGGTSTFFRSRVWDRTPPSPSVFEDAILHSFFNTHRSEHISLQRKVHPFRLCCCNKKKTLLKVTIAVQSCTQVHSIGDNERSRTASAASCSRCHRCPSILDA